MGYHVAVLSITIKSLIYSRQIPKLKCVSSPLFQLSLPNPLKPGITSRMNMLLEQRRQVMLQLHLSDQQFNTLLRCGLY